MPETQRLATSNPNRSDTWKGSSRRSDRGTAKSLTGAGASGVSPVEPIGPDAAARKAQDRVLAAGGKLSDPEKFKREEHPFDSYERLKAHAAKGEYPKPPDNFRWRYFGLFYVAPNQNSYMCRLRIAERHTESRSVRGTWPISPSDMAAAIRTSPRAPIFRSAKSRPTMPSNMVEAVQDLGLCSRGSGADNIRNVTGTATAGIDPQELIDTRPYAREWHFHILNDRSLYGLPRKFNVAFDGAGVIPVLEDTNDIGFQAVQVNDGFGAAPGVWFRLCLGGMTGHKVSQRDTGVIVKPGDATKVADAVVRVFIETRRPHRPHQGAAEICARQDRRREIPRADGGKTRPQARSRGAWRDGAASGFRSRPPTSACTRRSRPACNWIGIVRAGRASDRRADAWHSRDLTGIRRRRYPAHGLAELADFRRPD